MGVLRDVIEMVVAALVQRMMRKAVPGGGLGPGGTLADARALAVTSLELD
jgi:hypothetical protein